MRTPKLNEWFVPHRTSNGVTCVETKFTEDTVFVRNNLQPNVGPVVFTYQEWAVFIAGVKAGEYDL